MSASLFEQASRQRFRFQTPEGVKPAGMITTEDLWDLSLENLDLIAKGLNRRIKLSEEESFIEDKTPENKSLVAHLEIVKHVIKFKKDQAEAKQKEIQRRADKQILLTELEQRRQQSIKSLSDEEILKRLDETES